MDGVSENLLVSIETEGNSSFGQLKIMTKLMQTF
jgi:hypothetical protein